MRRVLLIQLRQLGDILLTTPVVRALKTAWPDVEITFLTDPLGRLILQNNTLIHRHAVLEKDSFRSQWLLMKDLRSQKFDCVIDFMGNPRSAMVTKLVGAKKTIGFRSLRSWLYSDVVERQSGHDYIVYEKLRMLEPIGIKNSKNEACDLRLMFSWGASHANYAQSFLQGINAPFAQRRVVLSPTHKRPVRRWSDASWVELSDWLSSKMDSCVIWVWGPGEEEEVKRLHSLCRAKSVLAPKTTLQELAALVAQCDFFVSASNGPSHFAVAVNTPSLQLHGPTLAKSWCPMTIRHRALQSQNFNDIENNAGNMSDISVAEVRLALETMFREVNAQHSERVAIHDSEHVWRLRPVL